MSIVAFKGILPNIDPTVFIAPNAWVTGAVTIQEYASLFFGVVVRGDIQKISIGKYTNLQEHVVLHTSNGLQDCIVGDAVTVGHRAILHGCTVQNSCIIGMGAVVLDGAVIGEYSIVGAQALVPMNTVIPPRSLVVGVPAKVVRNITAREIDEIKSSAAHYKEVSQHYKSLL